MRHHRASAYNSLENCNIVFVFCDLNLFRKNTDTTRRLFFEKIRKNRRKNNRSPWQPFDDDDGDDEDEDEDDDDDR